jgi:hypothetical protein
MPHRYKNTLDFSRVFTGIPKGNRTPVNAVIAGNHGMKFGAWVTLRVIVNKTLTFASIGKSPSLQAEVSPSKPIFSSWFAGFRLSHQATI